MGGAESFVRKGGVGRYLHIQMPLDLLAWSADNGPEWLLPLLGYNKPATTNVGRGTLLHLQNAATVSTGASRTLRRTAVTLRVGAADVGVTIEKPAGLRELHVDADGIVLDGVNLTVACSDFAASGRVSHAALRNATLHAPLACASAEREGDTILTVAKAGSRGHIIFEDLVDPDSTVVISRPDHTCTMQVNAPLIVGGVDLTACMEAVFVTMRTPEPEPLAEVGAGSPTTATTVVKFVVEDWRLDPVDDPVANTSHRQLISHAELDASTLAKIKKEVITALGGVGLALQEENVAIVASTLTEHTSSIDMTISTTEDVSLVLQKAVNETMHSAAFYVALGTIVLGDVHAITVTFIARLVSTAASPEASLPAGSVWWNGVTGDWNNPQIWSGGDVNNASEVFLCPPGPSNGTVFVRGYARANNLTLCNWSSDMDSLVVEGELCIGKGCP